MIHRRSFLRRSAAAATAPLVMGAAPKGPTIGLVLDGSDPVAAAPPVLRAAHALLTELGKAGYTVTRHQAPQQGAGLNIVGAGSTSPVAAGALAAARIPQPTAPESFALFEATLARRPAIMACGADARALSYALRELADRVRTGAGLKIPKAIVERSAMPVRSVMRQFASELYDKPWYYDRAMWPQYLSMLAANRFNRFQLAFGLGYDMLKKVDDPYFVFTYPFLLAVPGYDVKVTNLPDAERAKNLDTLRFISEQTVAHGLDFELGLWMHGYEWVDTPDAKYVVTGLTRENHAAYCRDALAALLKRLPAVSSVALRIHGESGIAEGSYDFWRTVFDGVPKSGRRIEIDLHAKGIDGPMIENAMATGMPVNVSPKFAAEHLGLPYHQADIRPSEIPAGTAGKGLMTISEGARSFTRYGYADLLRDDRKYTVRNRVFYGTQRILASGNVEAAAAYARAFTFCGMTGAELMEPLTCRGRRGSAVATSPRDGYANRKLATKYDWQKYDYWYRSWGRMMFNPDGDREACKRSFGKARALEAALASASRILPLVTNAHSQSAACDLYWPEIYWNMPLTGSDERLYWDTPSPKNFQNVTALDPQLFSSCREFAGELMGERSGKFSPVEVAMWLEAFSNTAAAALKSARPAKSIDAERLAIDTDIQIALGRFFAAKLRVGVLMALFERTNDGRLVEEMLNLYGGARAEFAKATDRANGVYATDLSVSDRFTERGSWKDRLKDIDTDIAALNVKTAGATPGTDPRVEAALQTATSTANRAPLPCTHTPPGGFKPGQPLDLLIAVREGLTSAKLWYRHVNQAERWIGVEMASTYDGWRGSIPAAYTNSPYPLQYYFEFRSAPERAWLYPGFNEDLLNQPYVVLRRM